MRGLAQRVALVTGAGGPMGRAIACRLAEAGAHLVLTDISGARLGAAVEEATRVAPDGGRIVSLRADATARAEAAAVAALGIEQFGCIDALVNVVGGIRSSSLYTAFVELAEDRWDSTFALNLKPAFHLVQLVAPGMIERGFGRIVNVSSVVFGGEAGQADYAAAKAAVASLTRSLAMEFAPHVNVNCVAPGLIDTSVVQRIDEDDRRRFLNKSLLKRLGRPGEIADVVAFLASDEASFMTGEILSVSGGNHPSL